MRDLDTYENKFKCGDVAWKLKEPKYKDKITFNNSLLDIIKRL